MIERPPNILVISSKTSELQKVEGFLKEVWEYYNLPENCFNKIFLCISEGVNNSITHGNQGYDHKIIELKLECENTSLWVEIADEGDGFDYHNVANPTKEENILKESGRGIHIIKSIANNVEFNPQGNCIRFQIDCK